MSKEEVIIYIINTNIYELFKIKNKQTAKEKITNMKKNKPDIDFI